MKSVLLRVDGSRRIGLGHILRCCGLGQGLKRVGVEPIFLVKECEEIETIIHLIRNYKFDVHTLPGNTGFLADSLQTADFAFRRGLNLIITDLCNTEARARPDELSAYHRVLREDGNYVITFDDGTGIDYVSDVIVSPYYRTSEPKYLLAGNQKVLWGPDYFIFRQEFRDAVRPKREIKPVARNVLVIMGGSDPFNLTVKIARALMRLPKPELVVKIVIGPAFDVKTGAEVRRALRQSGADCDLVFRADNVAQLMLWSDLAITGEGLTKYETAVTGTPSIMISQFDGKGELVKEFEKAGTTLHLGTGNELGEDDIAEAVRKVMEDVDLRAEMSRRGKALVDGKGVERVIASIPAEIYS